MTTAHRPTWKAAVGKANEGGWNAGGAVSTLRSALDNPAHLSLKTRKGAQVADRQAALKRSLLDLEQAEKEAPALSKRQVNPAIEQQSRERLLKQTAEVNVDAIKKKYDDSDIDDGGNKDPDNDDSDSDLDAADSDLDSDDDSDDDDDDEAALQAELEKIRAERAAVQEKEDQAALAEEDAKNEQAALLGNPLLHGVAEAAGNKRRRWNDDVVFRNQAKGEPQPKKRFINDTIRNDFHRRFLHKFIR
jgi:protein CWC15